MEDLGFDIGGILSEEEANKLFEEQEQEDTSATENETENVPAEELQENAEPEEVGSEESEEEEDAVNLNGDGSSPNVYSSIANALKEDGIFPDFDDSELESIETPDDFAELIERTVSSRLDERQRRIEAALNNGVDSDTVNNYEQSLQYLGSIDETALASEDDEGENLRKRLIYNDLINRGFSHERAMRSLEKSINAGSDVEDARDALESLKESYRRGYDEVLRNAAARAEQAKATQRRNADSYRRMILEDKMSFGDTVIDKKTAQRIYDVTSKPVYKDEKTGRVLTELQKFQAEKPLEFMKQIGMWYVLTDGGKDLSKIARKGVIAEKNKAIKELGNKLNSSSFGRDGSMKLLSNTSKKGSGQDPLLSDGWQIGWGEK